MTDAPVPPLDGVVYSTTPLPRGAARTIATAARRLRALTRNRMRAIDRSSGNMTRMWGTCEDLDDRDRHVEAEMHANRHGLPVCLLTTRSGGTRVSLSLDFALHEVPHGWTDLLGKTWHDALAMFQDACSVLERLSASMPSVTIADDAPFRAHADDIALAAAARSGAQAHVRMPWAFGDGLAGISAGRYDPPSSVLPAHASGDRVTRMVAERRSSGLFVTLHPVTECVRIRDVDPMEAMRRLRSLPPMPLRTAA